MPTPSRYPGVLVEDEGIDFKDDGTVTPPAASGQVRYYQGRFWFQDVNATYPLVPFDALLYNNEGVPMVDESDEFMLYT